MNRFFRERGLSYTLGWIWMIAIILLTLLAPWAAKYDPDAQPAPSEERFLPPSVKRVFGTDQFGRDVYARVLHGGRVSLFIALSVVMFSVMIGSAYGAVSGYFGGWIDRILMRLVDLFLSFPLIFLAVTCMALFGSGLPMLIIVLTLTGWMDIARLIRAEVQSIKSRPYILKARASGFNTAQILFKHLLPNVLITILTFSVIRIADIILIESALSFIGLGVQPPTASWGSIINDGRSVLDSAWWLTLFPGMAILFTTISLNFIGKGLQKGQE